MPVLPSESDSMMAESHNEADIGGPEAGSRSAEVSPSADELALHLRFETADKIYPVSRLTQFVSLERMMA